MVLSVFYQSFKGATVLCTALGYPTGLSCEGVTLQRTFHSHAHDKIETVNTSF